MPALFLFLIDFHPHFGSPGISVVDMALSRQNRENQFILFGGRLILAYNEVLYPYHKWFLTVLEGAKDRPADLLNDICNLNKAPIAENIEAFYEKVKTFQPRTDNPFGWPAQFMLDSELNWMDGRPPIDDLELHTKVGAHNIL